MDGIVYESNTGTTERYAKLLAEKTGLPVYAHAVAKKQLSQGAKIIYLSWLCAGQIKGYAKAAKYFDVQGVGAVGMSIPSEKLMVDIMQRNGISLDDLYYLPGSLDKSKLKGMNKLMLDAAAKSMIKDIQGKTDPTPDDEIMLHMLIHGGDWMDESYLQPLISLALEQ